MEKEQHRITVVDNPTVDRRGLLVGSIKALYAQTLTNDSEILSIIEVCNEITPGGAEVVKNFRKSTLWQVVAIRAKKVWMEQAMAVLRRQDWFFWAPGGPMSFYAKEEAVEGDRVIDELSDQVVAMASKASQEGEVWVDASEAGAAQAGGSGEGKVPEVAGAEATAESNNKRVAQSPIDKDRADKKDKMDD